MKQGTLLVFGLFLAIAAFLVKEGAAVTCFSCDQIPFPRDCKIVVKCGAHEECFADRIITNDGNTYFNTGCRDTQRCVSPGKRSLPILKKDRREDSFQTTICSECCKGDHCNYGGCGADPLPAKDKRGPICYDCAMMRDPKLCNQVSLCSRDEQCEVLKTPHPTFDVTYTAKCGTKALCDRLSGISHGFGRRDVNVDQDVSKRGFSLCFRCCTDDLCNLGCTTPNVTTTMSTTASSSTVPVSSKQTTTASTTTTQTSLPTSTQTSLPASTQTSPSTTTTSVTPSSTVLSSSTIKSTTTVKTTVNSSVSSTQPAPTFATNSTVHGCLPEYLYYGKSCYYFSKSSLYWQPSRKFCKDHGSDLAIINDDTENNLIMQHLKQLVAQHMLPSDLWGFYIGAHYVNGTWKWVDNTDVKYSHWAPKEPDNLNSQQFASIYVPSSGYYNYQWASHKDMYTTSYFICEFNQNP